MRARTRLASKEMRGAGHSVSDDPSPCLLLPHSLDNSFPLSLSSGNPFEGYNKIN